MDLNYLYYRYHVSLVRAENASCVQARLAHHAFAAAYAARISDTKAMALSAQAA